MVVVGAIVVADGGRVDDAGGGDGGCGRGCSDMVNTIKKFGSSIC